MRGSWVVQYENGEYLAQFDRTSAHAIAGEVPFRAIDWSRVHTVRFESQDAVTSFTVPIAPAGYSWSLRSRNWVRLDGSGVSAFMLVLSAAGLEADQDTTKYALFWYPDGTVHETPFFMSRETNEYGSGIIHALPKALVSSTSSQWVSVDAVTLYRPTLMV
jgi:hypothetical protein